MSVTSHKTSAPRSGDGPGLSGPGLETSPRFAPKPTRRDWLGLAAIWSALLALGGAVLGALRLPMPAVFPESNAQVKLGPPEGFVKGSATYVAALKLWVFRDERGLYAISSICTHLGCIAGRDHDSGKFKCPCHGSVFESEGQVVSGPAPSGLHWLHLGIAPDGQVVVDQRRQVPAGTRLEV